MQRIEVRCPENPSRLLMKVQVVDDVPAASGNRIEVACRDCRNEARRRGERALLVVHLFTVDGRFVETDTIYAIAR